MSDFAGPASGARGGGTDPWRGGTPPPVLLAALGAAALIAVTLIALVASSGDGGGDGQLLPAGGAGATATAAQTRVPLTVSIEGGGSGTVRIAPGVSCSESCEQEFASGTRLNVTADAASDSTFEGWGDACSDSARCSFVMDGERSLTATFEDSAAAPQCDEADPSCAADDTQAPSDRPATPSDCQDGRDNDGDGLTDAAQDPGCDRGSEADSSAAPNTPATPTTDTPAPPAATNECADGRDNDGDGLTDRAQDPNCATGTSEGGARQARSECRDGRDNDGDGLVDTAQDPGCVRDSTEAG
jgi:hypothetical protein